MDLHLSVGATVLGSRNRSDYRFQCMIFAEDAENISITGRGTVNGNGESFWGKHLNTSQDEAEITRNLWRPDNMMRFVRCNNMLLDGITIANSPCWTIHPIDCEGVTITGISLLNGMHEDDGPNTDGINPDGCSKVRISDCYIQCGDDCIVLKNTKRPEGRRVCRDIVVNNCVLKSTETALKIGTETHGDFRNIAFTNCTIHDSGGGIGLIMRDGGLIDGMVVSNITIDSTRRTHGQGIFIWSHRRADSTPWGMIRNVLISNMTINAGGGIFVSGAKEQRIEGLTLENIRIRLTGGRKFRPHFHDNPPDPFHVFGHHTAPYDVFCRHVNDLKLRNIQFAWSEPEDENWGSAMRCWHVKDLEIDGFIGRQALNSKAGAIWLKDVEGALIRNCRAPENTGTVLNLDERTERVTLMGNELSQAEELCIMANGVDEKELFHTGNRLPGS